MVSKSDGFNYLGTWMSVYAVAAASTRRPQSGDYGKRNAHAAHVPAVGTRRVNNHKSLVNDAHTVPANGIRRVNSLVNDYKSLVND